MSDYTEELEFAINTADEASGIIRKYTEADNFEIDYKGKNDLVTDADLETEEFILDRISNHFPDDQILAEETEQRESLPEGRVWIVDPIDGTTNFAHGFPVFCISIALWEAGEAKTGMVKEVTSGEVFSAQKGGGARRNGIPISVSSIQHHEASLIGTGFPYEDFEMMDEYISFFRHLLFDTHGVRRPGSATYDMCCVACGRFEGFFEYGLSPWDVAASSLIVQEAGGVVTDWRGSDQWLFGKRIVAGNSAIHQYLLKGIGDIIKNKDLSSSK